MIVEALSEPATTLFGTNFHLVMYSDILLGKLAQILRSYGGEMEDDQTKQGPVKAIGS